ncbi:MAG TPA: MBL fold metallo-hydrolase [Candidatus Saccharimonadales bacterium]|jgi:L-ascorbate metabolism protein UlaG (beta-lactamase superfamily)|nr:MBL fold metallo-hydrolase [Candidatus Saccharimonadales bacterium]
MSFLVTKYPQSCLLLEKGGKRLLIDPGSFVTQKYQTTDLLPVDGILITHEHVDHADPALLAELTAKSIPVIANQSTKNLLGDIITQVIIDQEEVELVGFRVIARELPHSLMLDGSPGPQNTGYVIDGVFFHPGDGKEIKKLIVSSAAIPIAGPDMSFRDSVDFALQLGCKRIIPVHNDVAGLNPETFKTFVSRSNLPFEIIPLQNGESTEL